MGPKAQNKRIAVARKISMIFLAIEVKEEMTDAGTNVDLQITNRYFIYRYRYFFLMVL